MNEALTKISAKDADSVLTQYEVEAPLAAYLAQSPQLRQLTPASFVAHLETRGLFTDLIKFLAHALPRREAVWWACAVAKKVAMIEPKAATDALKAAEE